MVTLLSTLGGIFAPLPSMSSASASSSPTSSMTSPSAPPSLLPLSLLTSTATPKSAEPDTSDPSLIARMHARHQSWASAAARSRSRSSESEEGSEGSESPVTGGYAGYPAGMGSSGNGAGPSMPSNVGYRVAGTGGDITRTQGAGGSGHNQPLLQSKVAVGPIAGVGSSAGATAQIKVRRKKDGDGKRRKVAKACLVCQKSHLTCDEQRPCTRCVKKNIADQCVEGVRKKAKYLMEGEGEPLDHPMPSASISPSVLHPEPQPSMIRAPSSTEQSFTVPVRPPTSSISPSVPLPTASTSLPLSHPNQNQSQNQTLAPLSGTGGGSGMEEDIWLAPHMLGGGSREDTPAGEDGGDKLWGDAGLWGNSGFDFGTSASNEYQMLDAMLNSMSPVFPFDLSGDPLPLDSLQQTQIQQPQQTQPPAQNPFYNNGNNNSNFNNPQHPIPSSSSTSTANLGPPNIGHTAPPLISPTWPINPTSNQFPSQSQMQVQPGILSTWADWAENKSQGRLSVGGGISPGDVSAMSGNNGVGAGGDLNGGSGVKQEPAAASAAANADLGAATWTNPNGRMGRPRTGAEVYHGVVKPFDYTEGYHRLMEHLSKNFEQREILRVVKALAAFRPSLIALQMPMSEEDEVFLERSFQRTLIELEKLISYSATPTAVWRRTGDLVYANPEFCALVGKQQDDLLSGRPYVYQLFAKHTAISYWENFSVHAFENTTQNFFQAATLELGNTQTACSCCFTIRRDVFDLPSVIIGQFLPIPNDM